MVKPLTNKGIEMVIASNPTHSIDSLTFQALFKLCQGRLTERNIVDLYYTSCYIQKAFLQWNANSDLTYYAIITEDRIHLLNDEDSFTIKRRMYASQYDRDFLCSSIHINRCPTGWQLRVEKIGNLSGKVIQ